MLPLHAEPLSDAMVKGRVFYNAWDEGEGPTIYTEIRFLPEADPSPMCEGRVRYKMLTRKDKEYGNIEEGCYWVRDGWLFLGGNDGSYRRYTLLRKAKDRWVLKVEENLDVFRKPPRYIGRGERVWYFRLPASFPDLKRCIPDPEDPGTCLLR
jgi:hypothetical protein